MNPASTTSASRGGPSLDRAPNSFTLLTGAGPAAIAVIRLRGPEAPAFLRRHIRAPWLVAPQPPRVGEVRRAALLDADGATIDDVLVSFHAERLRDVRLHLHGSTWLVTHICGLLAAAGFPEQPSVDLWDAPSTSTATATADAIMRECHALLPQVLTLRGVQWLARNATALRDTLSAVLAAPDSATARSSIDTIRPNGIPIVRCFTRPLRIAIVGPPNAGKSTLLNALADQSVSIVSDIAGTTRDWVEIPSEIAGYPCIWIDTAGLRRGADQLEAAGIARTRQIAAEADATVVLLDGGASALPDGVAFLERYAAMSPTCIALTKCDRPDFAPAQIIAAFPPAWRPQPVASLSAATGVGLNEFVATAIPRAAGGEIDMSIPCAFTDRQVRYYDALRDQNELAALKQAATVLLHADPD